MINKKYILSAMILCSFLNLCGEQNSEFSQQELSRQKESQEKIEALKRDITIYTNAIRPARNRMYAKYFKDIQWLGKNYNSDKERGNQIINDIVNEFDSELLELARNACEKAAADAKIISADWEMDDCQKTNQQFLRALLIAGMQEDSDARSTAYQTYKAKKAKSSC